MRIPTLVAVTTLSLALVGSGCGSSGTKASTSPVKSGAQTSAAAGARTANPPAAGAVDPNAPEVVAPGDIPDHQAFVTYTPTSGGFTVGVPEGWARTDANGVVTFTDKYNSIEVTAAPAAAAPTVASVQATALLDVKNEPTFRLGQVSDVTRKAGPAVLATYEVGSAPNNVTGKRALLAVERYVFVHNGNMVTLTLSGAKGADNVDPWRTVTDSLAWK